MLIYANIWPRTDNPWKRGKCGNKTPFRTARGVLFRQITVGINLVTKSYISKSKFCHKNHNFRTTTSSSASGLYFLPTSSSLFLNLLMLNAILPCFETLRDGLLPIWSFYIWSSSLKNFDPWYHHLESFEMFELSAPNRTLRTISYGDLLDTFKLQ